MSRLLTVLLLVIAICCMHKIQRPGSIGCDAKEIQATNEWTLLGENDTVDAGMHIRMDLQTGEKWVKLIDKKEEENQKQNAEVSAVGGLIVTTQVNADDTHITPSTIEMQDGADANDEEVPYDFEMMHRTLSQLPDEEKQQMLLPSSIPDKAKTPEERAAFEERMKQIWIKRQEQLRWFEENYLADMPGILKDRIQRIQAYFEDPIAHLTNMDLAKVEQDQGLVTHIISVLQDLEFQVTDVDMARDFFTMGGWSLLVSLMSDHHYESLNNATMTSDLTDQLHSVQAHAAWVLGTAVKNVGEFIPYATAEVVLVGDKTKTTALDLIVRVLPDSTGEKTNKLLYALGALLRGNRQAQIHFCALGGNTILESTFTKALTSPDEKIIQRLLNLANDIVSDVKLHAGKSEQVDAVIVRGFSSESWCTSVVAALRRGDALLQEKALHTLQTLAVDCEWDSETVKKTLFELRASWEDSSSERDSDVHRDLLVLLDSTLAML